jgi:hypothetical protein
MENQKETGRLMFKFDSDEPQQCAVILDYGRFVLEMQQQKDLDNPNQQPMVQFTSASGKIFSLYIENI